MPSRIHQSLTALLTQSPELIPRMIGDVLGLPIPQAFDLQPAPETVRETNYPEYTTDGTVIVRDRETGERETIIVEVQLRPDPDKRKSWPHYVSGLRIRLGLPTTLVVVTTSARTARWCAEPIDLGRGRMVLHPLVIGPDQIPSAIDAETARKYPALAVLAVIMHRHEPHAPQLAKAALAASLQLAPTDSIRATLYSDLILGFLNERAIAALELEMGTTVLFSDFARKHHRRGLDDGLADALRLLITSRGMELSSEAESTIARCRDADTLRTWLVRASTATSLDQVIEPSSDEP